GPGERSPEAGGPGPPREEPCWAARGREHESVEGLEGPDQWEAEQEGAAAEQRVRAGRVAGVVVAVDELAVGVAQIEVRIVLAVVHEEIRAHHVNRGVR